MRIVAGDTERMQNELKTHTTGTVITVHVQEGATVETGAALITVVASEAWGFSVPLNSDPSVGWGGDALGACVDRKIDLQGETPVNGCKSWHSIDNRADKSPMNALKCGRSVRKSED